MSEKLIKIEDLTLIERDYLVRKINQEITTSTATDSSDSGTLTRGALRAIKRKLGGVL